MSTPIDQLSYRNDGTYRAAVELVWKNQKSGKTYSVRFPESQPNLNNSGAWVSAGKKQVINLDELVGPGNHQLHKGDEVWAVIAIERGDTEECKKERYRFVYIPGSQAQVKYTTRGTSLNNNRCRLLNRPR